MRSLRSEPVSYSEINWKKLTLLIPYFAEFKIRIVLAILCLIIAKMASVYGPFILKEIIDYFEYINVN